jgi:Rhodopirellula transposase DDE domain
MSEGAELLLGLMGPELEVLLPVLDEKGRRLVLGAVARAAGAGGITAVAGLTGASWQTVADGAAELESGQVAPAGRVRRPGGGRKKLAETDPGLVPALLALVEDSSRGDPQSPLMWTTKSVRNLADELTGQGHRCSPQTCWRLLRAQGFSTQANAKVIEGRRHPDRDAQFRHIAAQAREHLAAGQPVISVDAKKRELVGQYAQGGQEWRPAGEPVRTADHGFAGEGTGHAIPYGVYDVGANTGFVNVGTGHNTGALAVESIRRWWAMAGKAAYPGAGRLLVSCDAGGSNGWKNRAWKAGLAELAAETGLEITVCHFPPGTSKWNKIEHRLFSQITLGWRARPLTSYQVIISTIAAVTTATGLAVTAMLDDNPYPTGTEISDAQMRDIEDRLLRRCPFHGEWNYRLHPAPLAPPRPPPPPVPGPAAALAPVLAALASPQLTGPAAAPAATAPAPCRPSDTPWKPSCWPPSATTASACRAPASPPCSAPTPPPSPPSSGKSPPCSAPATQPSHPAPHAPAPPPTCAATPPPSASPSQAHHHAPTAATPSTPANPAHHRHNLFWNDHQ